MSKASTGIFIIGAKRTPFGAFGGKLKNFNVTQLSVIASQAALAQARISGEVVDETFIGSVIHSSTDAAYLSRHVALKSNVPIKAPSLTINRLCGSGFEAVCLGAESIILGRSNITLCGGAENMSGSPMVIDGISSRWGIPLGKGLNAQDSLWTALTDSHVNLPMGKTAENLAAKYGITREQCDEFALR
jgi:acetyl-CoA acetyltransferase